MVPGLITYFAIPDRRLLQQLQAKDVVHVEHSIVLTLKITSGGSRPSDKGRTGGGGHPNPEIRVEGRSQKTFSRPFGPQFGPKIKGGLGSPGPSPGSPTDNCGSMQCAPLWTS